MTDKIFPNGFSSWQETHFEIVSAIALEMQKDELSGKVKEFHDESGYGGLYELAEQLTDIFEKQNEGRDWDGDFRDVIEEFIEKYLK